jgi:hypothetical protein
MKEQDRGLALSFSSRIPSTCPRNRYRYRQSLDGSRVSAEHCRVAVRAPLGGVYCEFDKKNPK